MVSITLGALVAIGGLAGCSDDPGDDQTTLDKAVDFLGGQEALEEMAGVRYEASGTRLAASESFSIDAPAEEISTFTVTVSHDVAGDRIRNDYVRTVTFLGGLQFTFSEIVDGQLGHVEGIESVFGVGDAPMLSTRWAAIREQHDLLNPHLLLLRALANPGAVSELGERQVDGVTAEVLELADTLAPIQLLVAAETGEIIKLETAANEFLLRDVTVEVAYDDWRAVGALMFPHEVELRADGEATQTETRSTIEIDPAFDAGTFEIPAGSEPAFVAADAEFGEINHLFFHEFSALGIPLDFRQEFVQIEEIATGVFHLTGGSHHSLVIEQANGLVVAEAPNYPERSDAILAELAVQFPGKPVTHVIVTHHHHDHSAGLRSFVAAGATVVTHELGESFYRDVFAAASTISPDTLSANPATPSFEVVTATDAVVLDDATVPVEIHNLPNDHSEDMVLIFVASPDGGVAFESDLYNPGNGGSALNPAFAAQLLTAIQTANGGLDVALVAGGHGAVAPLSELETFVAGPQP